MTRADWLVVALGLALSLGPVGARAQGAPPDTNPLRSLEASERDIRVTPGYAGRLVRVGGTVEPGCDVVVTLTSPGQSVAFARMGKVGPLWMSVGRVQVDSLPAMYKLKSTRPLQEILSEQEQLRHRLGSRGLEASLRVQNRPNATLSLNEILAARQAADLYAFAGGGVTRHRDQFSTTFFWPAGAPPGRYTIQAYAVRDGRVVGTRAEAVDVREVGIEGLVSAFARTHGVLYGLTAVALAVAIGWLVSGLFDLVERFEAIRAWRRRNVPRVL